MKRNREGLTGQEEAFIQGIEFTLDNHLDGITDEDIEEYNRLIEKRREAAGIEEKIV